MEEFGENYLMENGQQNSMKKETRSAQVALVLAIVVMLILPWLLTRKWWLFSFSETGQIGDTIGGITAPISGLLGAYLVFLALKAQVEANAIQKNAIREQNEKLIRKDTLDYIERTIIKIDQQWKDLMPDQNQIKNLDPKSVKFNNWMHSNIQNVKSTIINTFVFLDFILRKSNIKYDDPIFKLLIHDFYTSYQAKYIVLLSKIDINLRWESSITEGHESIPLIEYIVKDFEKIRLEILSKMIQV